ncbi:MAG: hypothetical protein K2X00_19995 [Nitrospiraceae bacterium]|nr:hypothetical protein [Nitrospiraceae bacterium]MBX9841259.1 hypothetical protein [Xanthobacteraceae bacterium]
MAIDSYTIHVHWDESNAPRQGNVDVEVRFENGSRYGATLFTIDNITSLMKSYEESGECRSGSYFWAADLIILRRLSMTEISKTVADLVGKSEFFKAFSRL